MFKQLTTSRMCPKSQKIRINHKNTSKIRVFFLKYSYIRVSSYKYERLIHTGNSKTERYCEKLENFIFMNRPNLTKMTCDDY